MAEVLVRLADVPEIEEPSNDLVLRRLVDAETGEGNLSVTWVRLAGRHRRLRTDRSTRLYYVIEGEGWFVLGEEPAVAVRTADIVLVPRGMQYELGGQLTYLVVNGPGFVSGDDVYE
jgi:mannose-6-phosphate isomerase-like protein (cupin superfamily)